MILVGRWSSPHENRDSGDDHTPWIPLIPWRRNHTWLERGICWFFSGSVPKKSREGPYRRWIELYWTFNGSQKLTFLSLEYRRMPSAFQRFRGFRSSEAQQNPKNGQFCDFVEFFLNFSAPVFLAFAFIVFGFLAAAGFDGRLLSTLCSCQNWEEQQRNPTLNNQQPQEQGTEDIAAAATSAAKTAAPNEANIQKEHENTTTRKPDIKFPDAARKPHDNFFAPKRCT